MMRNIEISKRTILSKKQYSQALDDKEFDRLEAILHQLPGAMNLEEMDGFLSALICAPAIMPMGEVFVHVWGENTEFASLQEAQEVTTLIMRHWNTIARSLNEEALYFPFLFEDDDGVAHGNDWARGFYKGMDFDRDNWAKLINDEAQGGWIMPIFTLVHEHDPDPMMNPGVIDEERRNLILTGMIAGLKRIHDYFAPYRRAAAQNAAATPRRSTPKVGRNEPCPCGSGRKYKHCCGRGKDITLH